MFSFPIGSPVADEEEVQSAQPSASIISEEIKAKLLSILDILDRQELSQLVQDAEPIRAIFKSLKGQLPIEVEKALAPVAFFEGQQYQFLEATQRISARAIQEQQAKEAEEHADRAKDIHRQIKMLDEARPLIETEINRLEAKRADLLRELDRINEAIESEKKKLEDLPSTIQSLKQERSRLGTQAISLRKKMKPVEGSAEEDHQIVESANQTRNQASAAIRAFLNI